MDFDVLYDNYYESASASVKAKLKQNLAILKSFYESCIQPVSPADLLNSTATINSYIDRTKSAEVSPAMLFLNETKPGSTEFKREKLRKLWSGETPFPTYVPGAT